MGVCGFKARGTVEFPSEPKWSLDVKGYQSMSFKGYLIVLCHVAFSIRKGEKKWSTGADESWKIWSRIAQTCKVRSCFWNVQMILAAFACAYQWAPKFARTAVNWHPSLQKSCDACDSLFCVSIALGFFCSQSSCVISHRINQSNKIVYGDSISLKLWPGS